MAFEEYIPIGFALDIFTDRYSIHKDETFKQACERVARNIADAEIGEKRDEYFIRFLDILKTNRFSPGGRIWRGAGRARGQLLNCFVYCDDNLDSREGWGETLKAVTIISGTGGGVGINFSKIRPRGSKIRGTGGEATGSVSLMRAINAVCNELREGGGRRCLPKDTLIHTDCGLIPIKDIEKHHKVQTMSGNFAHVISKEYTGKKKLIEIDTQMGKFYSSLDHRWAVLKDLDGKVNWTCAKDIVPEDRLVFINYGINGQKTNLPQYKYIKPKMATNTKDITIPDLTINIAWFFGQLHGDGNVCPASPNSSAHVSIACADDLPDQHKYIIEILQKFGKDLYIAERKQKTEQCSKPRVTSVQLFQYLSAFKKPKITIDVPEFILCGTRDIRAAYLAGILDADGYLGRTKKLCPIQVASSVYYNFLKQIRAILSSLGIVSSIKILKSDCRKSSWQQLYKIQILGIESIEKFRNIVAKYSCKYIRDDIKHRIKEQNSLTVPSKILYDSPYKKSFANIYYSVKSKSECSWTKFQNTVGKRYFQPIKVKTITSTDIVDDTYDIQVLNDEMFVAEGLLVHNSALLYCLDWRHPDLLEFLEAKLDNNELNNANISVLIDNDFLKLLDDDEDIIFEWQGKELKRIPARTVWDKIIYNSWKNGDPGILNYGLANEMNTISYKSKLLSTNPCGEQWLSHADCCNLGSINLHTHVVNGQIDWDSLEETVAIAVRFLDNVLDQNTYPLTIIGETAQRNRRIGLGVMGLHDMLLELGLKYSSQEARDCVDKVMNCVKKQAYHSSIRIAIEKGPFQAFDAEMHIKTGFAKKSLTKNHRRLIREHGIRNCALLCIAPTGTTSLVAGCSSGIEPLFQSIYKRFFNKHKDMHDDKMRNKSMQVVIHPLLKRFIEEKRDTDHFENAHDIDPVDHLKMQVTCQKHIDNSISKCVVGNTIVETINGPVKIKDLSDNRVVDSFCPCDIKLYDGSKMNNTSHFYFGGMRKTIKIKTQNGIELEATHNHKIKILKEDGKIDFKRMDSLKIGDICVSRLKSNLFGNLIELPISDVIYRTNAKKVTFPKILTSELSFLLGVIIAEGNYQANNCVVITNKNQIFLSQLKDKFKSIFNIDSVIKRQPDRTSSLVVTSRNLVKWMQEIAEIKRGAANKIIPSIIFRTTKENILSFLSGLFFDAYYTYNGKYFGICLATEQLIFDLQYVLMNLGIMSNKRKKYNREYDKFYYELGFAGKDLAILSSQIKFIEQHKSERSIKASKIATSCFYDKMPLIMTKIISKAAKESTKSINSFALSTSNYAASRYFLYHKTKTSRKNIIQAVRYFDDINNKELCNLKNSLDSYRDFVFQEITDIQLGVSEVFDVSIPSGHMFLGNNIVNHNTINLPKDYPIEKLSKDIREYIKDLKGITVYRDGSKGESPLVPLKPQEASKYLSDINVISSVNDCPSGKCNL